jgi:hypothetical protein
LPCFFFDFDFFFEKEEEAALMQAKEKLGAFFFLHKKENVASTYCSLLRKQRVQREGTLQFKREYSTSTNNTKDTQLGSYLAGLIEGDGNIYTPGLDVKGAPQIEIVFDIRDFELFKKIQFVIGGGTFYVRPNKKSGKITFKKTEYLLKVLLLINGHMRTPKIEALHRLIT